MINVVYLVLVFTGGSGKIATQAIPQANMAQCQVNAKNYGNIEYTDKVVGYLGTKAYCIVGVK